MRVLDLIQRDIVTCSNCDSLEHVAQLMWENDIGCLPVISDEGLVGMITDRDVCMAAFLQGAPLRSIAVSSVMSKEVVSCKEHDELADVGRAMQQRQIRRVPVIDDTGKLTGMISLNDIARAAHAGKVRADDVVSMLSAISRPRLVHVRAA